MTSTPSAQSQAPAEPRKPTAESGAATAEDSQAAARPAEPRPSAVQTAAKASGDLALSVEAALMSTDRPISAASLAQLLAADSAKTVQEAIDQLNSVYEQANRSFRIEQVAGGYQILTLPQYADILATMHRTQQQARLTPAALETLAIIAYRQPVLRADVEAIRGVACGELIRGLMQRRLVKIVGRAEELGRPMLYGTTKTFLELFGLASLKDLRKLDQLKANT